MLRKLSFLIITAMILTGCGAAAPDEAPNAIAADTTAVCETPSESETFPAGAVPEETPETNPETPEQCTAEYFRFGYRTDTVTSDDGLTILYEHQAAPGFTSADPERSAWVGEILDSIDRYYRADSTNLLSYAQEFLSMNGSEDFYSYSNYQQMGVARHDEHVVSLIALNSLYSGGTHPNSAQTAYNLDIENRRILRLEDVILESGAGELAALVRAGVDEKFTMIDGGNGLFEDYGATIDNSMVYGNMTAYWNLNDEGLVIFYNQYELGPYAAGIIKGVLPFDELAGILAPEYLPPEPSGTDSSLVLRSDPAGLHPIPISIEQEGQTLLVGVEGTVYQVQLSEVYWLENTPISQQILFSAKSLCENDVLEITGGYTNENRSFAIEYIDGRGEGHLLYIHDGMLSQEP